MWIKLDDRIDEHPKFQKAGPLGLLVWIAGMAYCNRNLTDGLIPWAVAQRLVWWRYSVRDSVRDSRVLVEQHDGGGAIWEIMTAPVMVKTAEFGLPELRGDQLTEFVINRLLDADLWHVADGGYVVHDYLEYQPSRANVMRDRERNNARQSRHRNAGHNAVSSSAPYPDPVLDSPLPSLPPARVPADSSLEAAVSPVRSAKNGRKRARARVAIDAKHIAAAAERFGLPEEIVRLLAERITLEADERGYRNLPSALLNWCQREGRPGGRGRDEGLSTAQIFAMADRMAEEERRNGN